MRTALLDFIFPPRCFGCGNFLLVDERGGRCCAPCLHTVHRVASPACPRCALPRDCRVGPDEVCPGCVADPPPFDTARAVWVYDGAVADAIRRAKTSGDPSTLLDLARAGAASFNALADDLRTRQWTTPPSHPRDLARRGWDPASTVARELLGPRGITLHQPLVKQQRTTKQARLDRRGRAAALRGVFCARGPVTGDWVVFDDVLTTGATLRAIAFALRDAGARSVVGVALARSV